MNEILGYNNKILSYGGKLITPIYSDRSMIRMIFRNCTHSPTDYTDWHSYDSNIGYNPWVYIGNNTWDYYPINGRIHRYEFNANGNPNITQPSVYGLLTKDRFGDNAEIYIISYTCESDTVAEHVGIFYQCDAIYTASNLRFPKYAGISDVRTFEFFSRCTNLRNVVNIDLTNVSYIASFFSCGSTNGNLIEIPNWDTSNIINASSLFAFQNTLTEISLFDTSSMTDVTNMFIGCRNVTQGALALYTQMSTQANPPVNYSGCFSNCGINTPTGRAELEQIPASWGGLGA